MFRCASPDCEKNEPLALSPGYSMKTSGVPSGLLPTPVWESKVWRKSCATVIASKIENAICAVGASGPAMTFAVVVALPTTCGADSATYTFTRCPFGPTFAGVEKESTWTTRLTAELSTRCPGTPAAE